MEQLATCNIPSSDDHDEQESSSSSSEEPPQQIREGLPVFKVLYNAKSTKCHFPRAIQCIKVLKPPCLHVSEEFEDFECKTLPMWLRSHSYVERACSALVEALDGFVYKPWEGRWGEGKNKRPLTRAQLRSSEKFNQVNGSIDIVKKIHAIRVGFCHKLSNPVGRLALTNLFEIAIDILEEATQRRDDFDVLNIGGRAPSCHTCCQIWKYYADSPLADNDLKEFQIVKQFASEIEKEETFVPDVQLMRLKDAIPLEEMLDVTEMEIPITAGVKSGGATYNEIHQAWMQSLVGLIKQNNAYAVLLTPQEAHLYELRVKSESGHDTTKLETKRKMYSFKKPTDGPFQTEGLIDLLMDILAILYSIVHDEE